jgi:arsenical pump membrane protein
MAPRVQRDRIVPVVATLAAHGLDRALTTVAGAGPDGLLGDLRLSLTTAASANLVDHLPAYLAMEPVADNTGHRLMLLLIGVNFGCLLTLWGSLATPLWRNAATPPESTYPGEPSCSAA